MTPIVIPPPQFNPIDVDTEWEKKRSSWELDDENSSENPSSDELSFLLDLFHESTAICILQQFSYQLVGSWQKLYGRRVTFTINYSTS